MERVLKQNRESENSLRTAQAKFTSKSREKESANAIDNSPTVVAQHKRLQSLFGGAIQRKSLEEEPIQGKFDTVQRVEEEEPLQGKLKVMQRVGEEEEPIQGRFDTVQRVEEEEPLQGKFKVIQRVGEEEEPLQGKFESAQRAEEEEPLQGRFNATQRVEEEEPLQGNFASVPTAQRKEESAAKPNNTGLPDNLKSGIETLSGMSMDKVKVHYNSSQPAQLNAHAYTQGTDIHVAPGQEKHLPHEAWHVVQQTQGRVQPTMQMKGGVPVNDDAGLESEADVMGEKAAGIVQGAKQDTRFASIFFTPSDRVGIVQRQILGESGFIKNQKLAELHSNANYSLGFTPPTVNFTQIGKAQDVVDAFTGKDDLISVDESTPGNFSASVKTVPTNHMGYMMYLPEPGPWKMKAVKTDILGAFGVRDNGRNLTNDIDIEITGPKGHEALAKQVENHEMVHAKDNERVRDEIFKPWDRGLSVLKNANTVFQGGSAEIASSKLWAQVGGSLAKKAADADAEWGKCSEVFHASKKGKTVVDNENTKINPEQTKAVFCYYLTI